MTGRVNLQGPAGKVYLLGVLSTHPDSPIAGEYNIYVLETDGNYYIQSNTAINEMIFYEHEIAGDDHLPDTLTNLNSKITDATLDDSSSPRNPNNHGASVHSGNIGTANQISDFDTEVSNNTDVASNTTHRGSLLNPHSTSIANIGPGTLAQLNAQVTDATLDDSGDPRDPKSHGVSAHSGSIGIASQISDFDTEVSNNTDVAANTTHRSSNGSDHTYIDQDVTSGSSPTFDGTNFSGIQDEALDDTYIKADGTVQLSSDWDAGSHKVKAEQLESDIVTGTAPLLVSSTTLVSNFNADQLDNQEGSYYLDRSNHTGNQIASTISDFDTEVSNNTDVANNTAKRSYPLVDETKLAGIEDEAEVNQTDSEIKIQYENNADTNVFTDAEKSKLGNQSGTNTGDITLASGDTTQQTLDLTGQEILVNLVAQSTDGAMSSEDKTKLDNISENCVGDSWVSGLDVTEQIPKDQTVLYTAGTYLICGITKSIASGGTYDMENAYGSINYYTGMVSDQHRFVLMYVDGDEVMKSIAGSIAEKNEEPQWPMLPSDSVSIALVDIKVDKYDVPKDIENKEIYDQRLPPFFNTDEWVGITPDDTAPGYLSDKLSNNGDVNFTIENAGGNETLKADFVGAVTNDIYYTEDNTTSTTTSTTYVNKLSLTKTFYAGDHIIDVYYVWRNDNVGVNFKSEVTLDSVRLNEEHIEEVTTKTSEQRCISFRRFKVTLTADSHTISLNYATSNSSDISYIYNSSITIQKVNIL